MPVVSQGQLSAEAIEQLVSSLHSISLVADRITSDREAEEEKQEDATTEDLTPDESTASEPVDPNDPFHGLLDQFDDDGIPTLPEESEEEEEDSEDNGLLEVDEEWAEDMQKAEAVQGHLLGGIPALKGVDRGN